MRRARSSKSAQAQLVDLARSASAKPRWSRRSPGIVGKRHVVPGEKVSAEQQLLTVVDLSTLELAGIGRHARGLAARSRASRSTCGSRARAATVPGRIDRIAPAAEAGTRAIGVVVVLDNRGERFRAGQYAQARVALADPTAAHDRCRSTAVGAGVGAGLCLDARERTPRAPHRRHRPARRRRPAGSRSRRA